MITEDKELLLKDLYARLHYGFVIHRKSDNSDIKINDIADFAHFLEYSNGEEFKPYLRPMSSMSDEEKKELHYELCDDIRDEDCGRHTEKYGYAIVFHEGEFFIPYEVIDWLNKHHFDYRGLIEKGLALEAPKGMYK